MTISSKNVFINCPYDNEYKTTLLAVVFTVKVLKFQPRLALESGDSGAARIHRILNLIKQCRYAIHDLSRLRARRAGELFRLNMPFELGLDIGCREFGASKLRSKKCLVLERERRSITSALSDLSNSDVATHEGEPEKAVRCVRNWLVQEAGARGESGTGIWYKFNDFVANLDKSLQRAGFKKADIDTLTLPEYLRHATEWIKRHP